MGSIFPVFGQKIIFSEIESPIDLKLGMEVYSGSFSQIWTNCGEICMIVCLEQFFLVFGQKIMFSETASPIDLKVGLEVPRGVII